MSTAAIVIARSGSGRLPNKNMLGFKGRPLIAHKVWQLKQCDLIDEVVVGADSDELLTAAEKEGAIVFKREPEFCDERSRSWNEVIFDMVRRVTAERIVWAHCTNPCIRPHTYDRAIEAYNAREFEDSLVSVTRVQSHVWWNRKPLNFDPWGPKHLVAADLAPVFFQNGGIFIAPRPLMLRNKYVYGRTPLLFEIPTDEATDIDTLEDYKRALRVYQK